MTLVNHLKLLNSHIVQKTGCVCHNIDHAKANYHHPFATLIRVSRRTTERRKEKTPLPISVRLRETPW